jgi:long-chain acyl-CoA synthetase
MLLNNILSHAVKLYPNKTALIDGDVRYTYRQASERVHRLAAGLQSLGVKPGENIAILANNSHRYWETYFVADIAGTPLAPLNIRLAAHELEFIVNDGEIKALFLGPEYLELFNAFKDKAQGIKHVILLDGEAPGTIPYEKLVAENEPLPGPAREWQEDDMLNLCYTGGTTGLPKGVMLTQRNVVSNATHAAMLGFKSTDTWLHVAPMFHLADAWACYTLTFMGGTHVFVPGFTPQGTLDAIQQHRVTKTILVPTMINFLINYPGVQDCDTSSLEMILYGASPMPVDRLLAAVNIFGPILLQAYGMTETAPLLTSWRPEWLDFSEDPAARKRLSSCGREIPGVEVRIVDLQTGEDVRPGQAGEIVARGPNVMKGYWKRLDATAEALRDGWMHTGDVATVDEDNFVYIVDRAKDMIITGGENVYSTEVENAIFEHPGVMEAAVIGVPDERWGEAVVAIVVPREGQNLTEDDIISHCKTLIAGYKCPKKVVFQSEPLPKSGPGKILKTELRKPYWEGQARGVN